MTNLLDYFFNDYSKSINNYYDTADRHYDFNTNYKFSELENNKFLIEIALPGHDKNSIEISSTTKSLIVKTKEKKEAFPKYYKEFLLEKSIKVSDANIKNGLLKISLTKTIPDEDKSKLITIN